MKEERHSSRDHVSHPSRGEVEYTSPPRQRDAIKHLVSLGIGFLVALAPIAASHNHLLNEFSKELGNPAVTQDFNEALKAIAESPLCDMEAMKESPICSG